LILILQFPVDKRRGLRSIGVPATARKVLSGTTAQNLIDMLHVDRPVQKRWDQVEDWPVEGKGPKFGKPTLSAEVEYPSALAKFDGLKGLTQNQSSGILASFGPSLNCDLG
jgi:hypothetical protein